jgi:hypothetical protein
LGDHNEDHDADDDARKQAQSDDMTWLLSPSRASLSSSSTHLSLPHYLTHTLLSCCCTKADVRKER